MKTITIPVDPRQSPLRIDLFLAARIPNFSRTQAQKAVEAGLVAEGSKIVERSNYKIVPGTTLVVTLPYREEVTLIPQDIPLDILYEDDDLMVICKPAGLVVHPAFGNWDGTLANAILHHLLQQSGSREGTPAGVAPRQGGYRKGGSRTALQSAAPASSAPQSALLSAAPASPVSQTAPLSPPPDLRPGIIHRLDKDTSGVMVVAKNAAAKSFLQKQFQTRTLDKRYTALLHGKLAPKEGKVDAPIGRDPKDRKKMSISPTGRTAQTSYRVLEYLTVDKGNCYTLIEARLHTGRTHQIRVHFASIGHPIYGDQVYGHEDALLRRQFLHASRLTFALPGGHERTFEAPLSSDLLECLKELTA
ncbi:hypothetical protein AUK40_03395 [Candidatus Wirthbacteria bacterium CG2_30_54_11]|uniref:RNA-binding S4 domain-containing protein n=1 Tax=Candidatus Wirthbacteria bacterium CG2_30_54_11 TaxID=1817892 RepID=A0A1J5IJG8_9BACT|nr:MAG: hypothetical protein AUK40_03395 [Candidatus Wirthbacteria bacterium CG2_30_54_11]